MSGCEFPDHTPWGHPSQACGHEKEHPPLRAAASRRSQYRRYPREVRMTKTQYPVKKMPLRPNRAALPSTDPGDGPTPEIRPPAPPASSQAQRPAAGRHSPAMKYSRTSPVGRFAPGSDKQAPALMPLASPTTMAAGAGSTVDPRPHAGGAMDHGNTHAPGKCPAAAEVGPG